MGPRRRIDPIRGACAAVGMLALVGLRVLAWPVGAFGLPVPAPEMGGCQLMVSSVILSRRLPKPHHCQ